MNGSLHNGWRLGHPLGAVLAGAALLVGACGGAASTSPASQSSGTTSAPASQAAAPSNDSSKPVRIAFIMLSTSNAYQSSSLVAAQDAARRLNATLTVFDGNFDANTQISQLENITSLGTSRFDAVALGAADSNLEIPAINAAIAAGLKVGIFNATIGPRLDTADIQLPGLAVQVSPVFSEQGRKAAELAVDACQGIDPCKVAYVIGLSNWAPERDGFHKTWADVLSKYPNIHIVATVGDGGFSREGGQKVISDLVQAHPDLNVIQAADQSLLGAEGALKDAGLLGKIKLIGWGGSFQSKDRIADGRWFATAAQAPAVEGRIVIEALVDAVRTGKAAGGVDSTSELPDNGKITKQNVEQFQPEFSG